MKIISTLVLSLLVSSLAFAQDEADESASVCKNPQLEMLLREVQMHQAYASANVAIYEEVLEGLRPDRRKSYVTAVGCTSLFLAGAVALPVLTSAWSALGGAGAVANAAETFAAIMSAAKEVKIIQGVVAGQILITFWLGMDARAEAHQEKVLGDLQAAPLQVSADQFVTRVLDVYEVMAKMREFVSSRDSNILNYTEKKFSLFLGWEDALYNSVRWAQASDSLTFMQAELQFSRNVGRIIAEVCEKLEADAR